MSGEIIFNVAFSAIASTVLIFNYRKIKAIARWITKKPVYKVKPECGDEVWYDNCGQGGCDRIYEVIDAVNSRTRQILLKGGYVPLNTVDLVWCKYYRNWKYEEGRHRQLLELEKARRADHGWKKC
jgi:hypothetical protein